MTCFLHLQVLSTELVVGIGVGAGVLVVVALVIAAVLLCARSVTNTSAENLRDIVSFSLSGAATKETL